MSQTNETAALHKILIKQRSESEGRISTGGNTAVFLDGKKLKGVHFAKLEFHARRVTKIVLEIYAEVEVEVAVEDLLVINPKK